MLAADAIAYENKMRCGKTVAASDQINDFEWWLKPAANRFLSPDQACLEIMSLDVAIFILNGLTKR